MNKSRRLRVTLFFALVASASATTAFAQADTDKDTSPAPALPVSAPPAATPQAAGGDVNNPGAPPAEIPPPPPGNPPPPPSDAGNPVPNAYEPQPQSAPAPTPGMPVPAQGAAPQPGQPPTSQPYYYPSPQAYPTYPTYDEEYYYRRHRRYSGQMDFNSSWYVFGLAEAATFQTGVHQYTPYFNWSPRFSLKSGSYYFGFSIGVTDLEDATSSNFLSIDYAVTIGAPLGDSPIGLEAGIGGVSWCGDNGGAFPMLTGGLWVSTGNGILNRVFANYSAILVDGFYTSQVRLGLQFSF